MSKMTKEEAENELYQLWSNGEIPSNFTYEHSEFDRAVEQMMKNGKLEYSDFF
ncbi:hypothetical protein [Gillisia marina]|uniref:hypothetical protein n=1 Tax=Gillisia marina TaxID=1167637 RepID=UPI0002E4C860|nr:hypothetical protein [Gillisia marina]